MTAVDTPQPDGTPWLAINDRTHFAVRAVRTRAWRSAAAANASQQARPIPGPVEIHAVIHKSTRVRYDLDGATATVKACIDGLRDASIIGADDHGTVVRLTVTDGGPRKPGGVVLHITPSIERTS